MVNSEVVESAKAYMAVRGGVLDTAADLRVSSGRAAVRAFGYLLLAGLTCLVYWAWADPPYPGAWAGAVLGLLAAAFRDGSGALTRVALASGMCAAVREIDSVALLVPRTRKRAEKKQ